MSSLISLNAGVCICGVHSSGGVNIVFGGSSLTHHL